MKIFNKFCPCNSAKLSKLSKLTNFPKKLNLKKHSTKQYHMTSKNDGCTAAYQSKILITITKQKN